MKMLVMIILIMIDAHAWEINTHRAINRKALEKSVNLQTFIDNSDIGSQNYISEKFEGYGSNMTYIKYVLDGEENGISANKWNQIFNKYKTNYRDLIEAGSILEDAQWQHFLDGGQYNYYDMADGRFVNHFYDAQNGGHALTYGVFLRTDAFNIKILREVV